MRQLLKRIKSLNRYQKGVLLVMAAMFLVFTAAYAIITSREGIVYHNGALLVADREDGVTTYSGRVLGEPAVFTVWEDKRLTFQYGDHVYGPYTLKEDPSAVPANIGLVDSLTGLELRRGDEILFRGGMLDGDYRQLYNEDGSLADFGISIVTNTGVMMDENGRVIDPMEPAVSTIVNLLMGPRLTHKGQWSLWLIGVIACAFTAVTILYADELFRRRLSLQIQNAQLAEPSDWEITNRYIAWTVLPVLILILFIAGLTVTEV